MPDRMPDRMPEDMSDRMPEDLPVTKCINVLWICCIASLWERVLFFTPGNEQSMKHITHTCWLQLALFFFKDTTCGNQVWSSGLVRRMVWYFHAFGKGLQQQSKTNRDSKARTSTTNEPQLFFQKHNGLMKSDETWWKHQFHQISSGLIKFYFA